MKHVTIYHNPKCSNSRGALEILRAKGIEPVIVEYLKDPLSESEIKRLSAKTGLSALQMIREKEAVFTELKLDDQDDAKLFAGMADHPILMNRPIVETDDKAMLCRPPEKVEELL